jgi:hypothetical protein
VVDDGLVLTSEQNVMKIGFDGTVKFSKYYPAPREPALVRALLVAQAVGLPISVLQLPSIQPHSRRPDNNRKMPVPSQWIKACRKRLVS